MNSQYSNDYYLTKWTAIIPKNISSQMNSLYSNVKYQVN